MSQEDITIDPYSLDVPYGSRLMLSLMIDRAEPDGSIRLPYWQAAAALKTTQASAIRMINTLVDAGVVTREWTDPNHRSRGCVYRFVSQPIAEAV